MSTAAPAAPPAPPTLSELKALQLLGEGIPDPDAVCDAVLAAWPPAGVIGLAGGLLTLHTIGAGAALRERLGPALTAMAARAGSREEHFMSIAVIDECAAGAAPPRSVAYFRGLEQDDGTFGPDPLQNAIASSALLRAGAALRDPSAVAKLLLEGALGGDLWTTYCAMRALSLLDAVPPAQDLAPHLPTVDGADGRYQRLSVLDWLSAPVLAAARAGDTDALRRHLRGGGDPDLTDPRGWSLLCAAAAHGQAAAVAMLLDAGAEVGRRTAGGLPVYWAGQSGDTGTVRELLARRPDQLHATHPVNGHTVLLQAVFYGTDRHRALTAWLLERATPADRHRMLAACNVRGYTATGMARLWNDTQTLALLSTVDTSTAAERDAYRDRLLASIAPPPHPATDALVAAVADPLDEAGVTAALAAPGLDLNRRGGPLSQTPLIAALTGTDPDPATAAARLRLVTRLLDLGADPDLPELHPMGVDAVIRAAVLGHFACLREIARHMRPLAFAAALNERPAVNGQTALDDTVHRALTAPDDALDEHLAQLRWSIARGARTDIPDHTGVTPTGRARAALADPARRARAEVVLAALDPPAGGGGTPPAG